AAGWYPGEAGPAARHDPTRELGVLGRVVAVDAATEHRDGRAGRVERAAVRLTVDAARETAHDDEPGGGEVAAERPRDARAVCRARACADDRDRRPREQLARPGAPQAA